MIEPIYLQCNHLVDAKGIDSNVLSFAWKLEEKENHVDTYQSAYQIIVKDCKNNVIYDSGIVDSCQQRNQIHTIEALQSSQSYFWQVRVWNERGEVSPYSEEDRFITGLLKQEDWKEPFVTASASSQIDSKTDTVWYRNLVQIEDNVESAICHIGCIGQFELYVNGKKVEDRVLSPSRSKLDGEIRVLVLTYDLSDLLTMGENVIGLWCDAGWARSEAIVPGFCLQLSVNGTVRELAQNWNCMKSGIRHIGNWQWADFGGEEVTLHPNDHDWCTVECNDEEWFDVTTMDVKATLSSELTKGDQIVEMLTPVAMEKKQYSTRLDMGKNYTGWIRLELKGGVLGDSVTIKIADKPEEEVSFQQINRYIFNETTGVFCNKFNYFAGRYITVEYKNDEIEVVSAVGLVLSSSRLTSYFRSSNLLLNQIYDTELATYCMNTLNGVTVDCPHRERLGYGETGISTIWGVGIHCWDSEAYYRNYFRNWRDMQHENGYLPHVAPNSAGGGGTTWSCCLTIALYDYYQYYKNQQLVEENYIAIVKWAEYLLANVNDGIYELNPEDAVGFGFLGDWASFEGNDWKDTVNAEYFNNCVAIYTLSVTATLAKIKGDMERYHYLMRHCAVMRCKVHERFYDTIQHTYMEGQQRYLSVALCAQIVPEEKKQEIINQLLVSIEQKGYLDGGSAGMVFILRAVGEIAKRPEVIYSCLTSTKCPSYGYFIEQGQTTWPELWDMRDLYGGSRIHTCYTGIVGWYTRYLLGIQPKTYGMKEMILSPIFPEELTELEACHDYGYGELKIQWTRKENHIVYQVTVPPNVSVEWNAPKGYIIEKEGHIEKQQRIGSGITTMVVREEDGKIVDI